jgi:hypothetical protein
MNSFVPSLIGIAGKAGTGKDTLADYLVRHLRATKYSFALPLKASLNAAFGWKMENWNDREWKERVIPWLGKSPRQCAQLLGTDWGREMIHPSVWVFLAEQEYLLHVAMISHGNPHGAIPPFVIPDVRFDNEAEMIRSHGGVVIRLQRPDTEPIAAHKSEDSLREDLIDITYVNDGSIADMCRSVSSSLLRAIDPASEVK